MKQKLISIFLTAIMAFSLLPTAVYAASDHTYYSQYGNVNKSVDSKLCYLTAFAMVITDLGKNVSPADVYKANGSTAIAIFYNLAKTYGVTYYYRPQSRKSADQKKQAIIDALNSGKYPKGILVCTVVNGKTHMVVARKVVNNEVYFDCPANGCCITLSKTGHAPSWSNVTSYCAFVPNKNWTGSVPTSYTITFDANGGSVSPSTQTVAKGSLIGQLPTPTRTGYQFLGWFDSKNSGSMRVTPGSVYVNEDQTLYALWKPICTEHTYNEAGVCTKCSAALDYDNDFDSSAAGTYQVSASEALVRSGPYEVKDIVRTLRQGETVEIVGSVVNSYHNTWLKTSDGRYIYGERLERNSAPKPPVQEEAKSFQVILDDGYVCQMITVTNGQAYGTLPTPSRDGYEFDGWYTKQSGGEKITASTVVNLTSDQTLYAHWKEWGPWSEWSTTPAYASSTRQVETREVKVSDSYTEYRYGRYVASGHDCWCGKYLEGLSYVSESARLQYSPWSTTQYGTSGRGWSCGPCSARHIGVDHTGSDGRSWWAEYLLPDGSYYWQETQTVGAVYETQYRYRDLIQ